MESTRERVSWAAMGTLRTLAVVPALDERGKIGQVVSGLRGGLVAGVVVVDDGSSDGTGQEAEAAGASVIRHEKTRGVGAAIRSGIDHARAQGFDVVVVFSGDNQHDPADLPRLLGPIHEEGFDLVQGSRRLGGLRAPNIGWFRRFATWSYALLFRLLTGVPITDATNGGRAFRLRLFEDGGIDLWQPWLDSYELEPYLLYKAVRGGYRVKEVPITVVYHDRGTTKMKAIRDWWRILRPLVLLTLGLRR